jgi:hypothetical protein
MKDYLDKLETYELLKICCKRDIKINNESLVMLFIQEMNSSEININSMLKFIVELLNSTNDIDDLKVKL